MVRTTSQRRTWRKLATMAAVTATLAFGLVVVPTGTASAADVTLDLYAVTGSTTLPDGVTVPVLGYSTDGSAVTAPGGPTLTVNEGQTVDLVLHNDLSVKTGLLLRGQEMVPDLDGVVAGGTTTYSFTATRPGTYLYEAALLPGAQYQSAMGLVGALVVNSATAGQAYGSASTAYDQGEVLVLSEIDPALNNAADPATFDMRTFQPRYSLINGTAFPDTSDIAVSADSDVLLRYVNAGQQYRSMAALGAGQSLVALDGSPLSFAGRRVAETFGPGQTADAILTMPSATEDTTKVAVYDGSLLLHNSNAAGPGGMLVFLSVPGTGPAGDTTGPVVRNLALSGSQLTATADDTTTGGGVVAAAEYYLDDVSGAPTGVMDATDAAFDATTEAIEANGVSVPSGQHIVYVRAQDTGGNWGVFSSVLVDGGDVVGPVTSDAKLVPATTNGSVDVAVSATASDADTGGGNIAAAEFTIDAGAAEPMVLNKVDTVAGVKATIPASTMGGLTEGVHVVAIRSQDAAGNWGDPVTIDLWVDKSGPVASNISIAPNPNNGKLSFNGATPGAARLTATLTDEVSGAPIGVNSDVRKVEAFIDVVGAPNTGIRLGAVDGVFDEPVEDAYVNIPLTTIRQLTNGDHTIYVRGRDRAKNWGAESTTTLVVDKAGPQVSAVDATPNPTAGVGNVALTASATDNLSSVVAAEWWVGTNPGVGNADPMSVTGTGPWDLSASVDVSGWAPGSYRLKVRAKDALGNWGPRASVVLVVN